MDRRQFLLTGGTAALFASLTPRTWADSPRPLLRRPRNLIFLVSDGMGIGTLALAEEWKLRTSGQSLHWLKLLSAKGVTRALQNTASANSPVTDSAAAASAWGCGHRVNNGAINYTPDSRPQACLYTLAKEAGYRTGLVTTTRATHATPAGFAVNVKSRRKEREVALGYLANEVDCVLGGGEEWFLEGPAGPEIFSKFAQAGYRVLRNRTELLGLNGINGRRLLGIFCQDHLPYAVDRPRGGLTAQAIPSLTEMMAGALDCLRGGEKGFFLQVEAGRVDHAGHANDAAAILRDQLEFDECIAQALAFQEEEPETLILITTDHGCGGAQLNGIGPGYLDSGPALSRLTPMTRSFEGLYREIREGGDLQTLLARHLQIDLPASEAEELHARVVQEQISSLAFCQRMGQLVAPRTAVGWTSQSHTAEHVEFTACGPGAEAFSGYVQNAAIFHQLVEIFSLAKVES